MFTNTQGKRVPWELLTSAEQVAELARRAAIREAHRNTETSALRRSFS